MPKEEWGTKRVCPTTGKRFYDLNKDPIVSPYTGDIVTIDQNTKSRVAIAAKPEKKAPVEEDDNVDLVDDDEDVLEGDDSDVDLDDDILEDEDDDNVSLDEIADVSSEDEDT